jgi:hypothetical protein
MNIKSLLGFLHPAKFATLRYQIILIILSSLICLTLFYNKSVEFTSTDPRPEFKILTPDSVQNFLGASVGSQVEVGMHIENFQEFNLRDGTFAVDIIAWFKFNPSVISLETIGQFTFEKGRIEEKSKPKTKLINGTMLAQYNVRLRFTTNLDYRLFPLNDNRIFIMLINKQVSPGDLIFESSESNISLSKNMFIPGWITSNHAVVTGYTEAVLDRNDQTTKVFYPIAVFFIDFARSNARQALILLLPLFVLMYILFISLTFSFEYYTSRLTLASANIAALLSYRFVIEGVAPKTGYYMLSDHIYNIFLVLAFIIFLVNIALREKGTPTVRGSILICLHSILLFAIYYLVVYWMQV